MGKFTFAMIDAKDTPVVGIDDGYGKNIHNERIRRSAEKAYLNGIAKLQDEINRLLGAQLAANAADPKDDLSKCFYTKRGETHKFYCLECDVAEAVDRLDGHDSDFKEADGLYYT